MKKAVTILLIILCITVASALGIFYILATQSTKPNAKNNFCYLYLQLERFLNISAQQIQNPLYAVAPPPPVSPEAPNELMPSPASLPNPPAPADLTKDVFSCASNDFNCYDKYYRAVVKDQGVQAAFADLKVRYNNSSYVQAMCHPITHVIGQAAAIKYPKVSDAYLHGDSFCWSGYYHGVLEGVAFGLGKDKMLASLNDICKDIPGKDTYSFDYYNCVHGLGHGLMEITQDQLFDSLTYCDRLNGSWEQTSCYGGVFMENIMENIREGFTKYLKPSDPLYPCNAVDVKYKQSCYLMQTSYMLSVTNSNFTKVFDLCSQADSGFVDTCYQSLGRDASGRSVSDPVVTNATCSLGKDYDQKSNCIMGAAKDFVAYFHSDVQAKKLCSLVDANLQDVCNSTVTSYYQSFK